MGQDQGCSHLRQNGSNVRVVARTPFHIYAHTDLNHNVYPGGLSASGLALERLNEVCVKTLVVIIPWNHLALAAPNSIFIAKFLLVFKKGYEP